MIVNVVSSFTKTVVVIFLTNNLYPRSGPLGSCFIMSFFSVKRDNSDTRKLNDELSYVNICESIIFVNASSRPTARKLLCCTGFEIPIL